MECCLNQTVMVILSYHPPPAPFIPPSLHPSHDLVIIIISSRYDLFLGDVKKNKKIRAVNGTWGPFFRISFDLIIHSYVKGKGKQGWSSVLAFDRKPSVDLNKNGELRFFFHIKKYNSIFDVELNKWYNISIEQKLNHKKVRKISQTRVGFQNKDEKSENNFPLKRGCVLMWDMWHDNFEQRECSKSLGFPPKILIFLISGFSYCYNWWKRSSQYWEY